MTGRPFITNILILTAVLMPLYGCGKRSSSPNRPVQGRAYWAKKASTPTNEGQKAKAPEQSTSQNKDEDSSKPPLNRGRVDHNSGVDINKVAKDVGVLTPPPGYRFDDTNVGGNTSTTSTTLSETPTSPSTTQTTTTTSSTTTTQRKIVIIGNEATGGASTPDQPPHTSTSVVPIDGANSNTNERQLKAELDRKYLAREAYDPLLVKQWINALRDSDVKETREFTYGNKYKHTLLMRNESRAFIRALESLMSLSGKVRVPLYKPDGTALEEREIDVGGDIFPELDGAIFRNSAGQECDSVLCVLSAIHKPDNANGAMFPEKAIVSEDAAYDILFIYFRFQYLTSLQVPKERFKNSAGEFTPVQYEKVKQNYHPLSTDAVRILAQSLWKLPSTFHGLSSLLTIQWVAPFTTQNSQRRLGVDLYDGSTSGLYLSGNLQRSGDSSTAWRPLWGNIIFNKSTVANFCDKPEIRVFKIDPQTNDYVRDQNRSTITYVRPLTDAEIRMFRSDTREWISWRSSSVMIHEITHAYDWRETISDSDLKARGLPPMGQGGMTTPGHISMSAEWLSLSHWRYVGDLNSKRTIPGFIKLPASGFGDMNIAHIWDMDMGEGAPFWWSYGQQKPSEDLAVAAEGYVTEPTVLQTYAPNKFTFLEQNLFTFKVGDQNQDWKYSKPEFISEKNINDLIEERFNAGNGYYDFSRQETRPTREYELRPRVK